MASEKFEILLVTTGLEDELASYLQSREPQTTSCVDHAQLRAVIGERQPLVAALGLQTATAAGAELCRWIRSASRTRIIVVAPRLSGADRVILLESGADSVISSDVEPRELLARIRALARRPNSKDFVPVPQAPKIVSQGSDIAIGACRFNPGAKRLTGPSGETIDLSAKEFLLLEAFLNRPNRLISKAQLADLLGATSAPLESRAIDAAISRLRRKLAAGGGAPELIETHRGEGYSYRPAPLPCLTLRQAPDKPRQS